MKYKLITYGCQMNDYDSQVISSILEESGALAVELESDADIIILNTCCVRNSADDKVYGRLGQYKALKDHNPDLTIAVCGCLAQKDKGELLNRFPHVDMVLGTHNLKDLGEALKQACLGNRILKVSDDGGEFLIPGVRKQGASAFVTISIGCDCFCTYCIVPYVRGRLVSKPFEDIVHEVETLAGQGILEIFLLGQNVNTYGFDLPGKPTFTELLERLNRIGGIRRIRFTSPHPKDFPPDLIDAVGDLDKVCKSIHLPLQSGSERILKQMNRRYTKAQYLSIVEGLRKRIPHIAISTDLIVGFPGETNEEFEESMEFIRQIQFDQAFMFAYSIRNGTTAARMPDHLPKEEKMERLYKLIEMQNLISRKKNEEDVGQMAEALVERVSKKDSNVLTGRIEKNKVVNFPGNQSLINNIVPVKLTKAYTWGFMGRSCL